MYVCVFRDALLKMKAVYEQSPQMGDADSLEPRLEEVKQILQKLGDELKKNQVYITNAHNMQCTINIQQCVNKPVVSACIPRCGWRRLTTDCLKMAAGDIVEVVP